jgi:transposase
VVRALWTGCQWKAIHREWFGVSSSVVHERFQRWRQRGIFEKLMKSMAEYYAKESGGISWKWQAMDSKNSPAPLGGEKTGKNPTDRGKRGAKMNLLVDQRGAPLSVVLTGANRHDKVAAIDLIVSIALKRPAHKEQHLCAYPKPTMLQTLGSSPPQEATPPTSRSIPERKTQPNPAANPPRKGTPTASLIRREDGWWSGRFPG